MMQKFWIFGLAVVGVTALSATEAELPFQVGEKLHYKVSWGIFDVGTATMEVKKAVEVDGYKSYHVVAVMDSNSLLDKIYPVQSGIESFIDAEGLFSRKFVEDRHEGHWKRLRTTVMDYEKGQGAISYDKKTKAGLKTKTKTFELSKPTQDAFSSIYYLRTQPLKPHSKQTLTTLGSDKISDVELVAHEKKTLSLGKLGKFSAIRIEPSTNYESIFNRLGKMNVWVSADDRKIPLLLTASLSFGSIKAVLTRIEDVSGKIVTIAEPPRRAPQPADQTLKHLLPHLSRN